MTSVIQEVRSAATAGNALVLGPGAVSNLHGEIEKLRAALLKAKREHYYCSDSWYSCPKAPDGCSDHEKGTECDCGADKFNAEIDAVLRETAEKSNA